MAALFPPMKWHFYWPLVKGGGADRQKPKSQTCHRIKKGHVSVPPREEPQDDRKLSTCRIAILLVRLRCSIKTTTWESYTRMI